MILDFLLDYQTIIHALGGTLVLFMGLRLVLRNNSADYMETLIHDDADTIAQKMRRADVLVFATPVYYYEMCGQMKTMLDRANPLYGSDYTFRDVYLLATATEKEESAMDGAVKGMSGWVECFPKAKLGGTIFGGGVSGVGAIKGHPALEKAYEMGKAV